MNWFQSFVASLPSLAGSLSQNDTNGVSQWGVLPSPNLTCPDLPFFDPSSNDSSSSATARSTSAREYYFTATRETKSPDGQAKSLILINGQFPGPLLEANYGETVRVHVTNNIADEGVSLHWHGLTQMGTPYYDGVPGVSQCPIAPGKTYTYEFKADQYGTSWYHSHYSGQYGDGLFGPMVIHGGPTFPHYDYDLGPVMLQDYFYESYYNINKGVLNPLPAGGPIFPTMNNNLINGKGITDCSNQNNTADCQPNAGIAKFNFTTGATHRLRLMNVGTAGNQKFSIENHTMTVVANDFVPVVPYQTNVVTLAVGQRTDILVKATGKATDVVWMHSEIDVPCLGTVAVNPHGLAAIYYPQANQTAKPSNNVTFPTYPNDNCVNDPISKTTPLIPSPLPPRPATTSTINITLGFNSSNNLQLFMNGQAFTSDYNDPTLFDVEQGQTSWPAARNVYNFGSNSSVQMILINEAPVPHPMHLHGHNFWVLAEGLGTWDGTINRPSNPQRRDTQMLQPATSTQSSYIVLEWMQDNPGVWPLHCHLAAHVSVGLYINVLELPDRLKTEMEIPSIMKQTCTDWSAFTAQGPVDQIDSGV